MQSQHDEHADIAKLGLHPSLRLQQIQRLQLTLQFLHRTPWKNGRVLPLVRRILQQPIRPAATTYQRQQWPAMQPRKTNLRDRARTTADDDARIAGKRHQQISRIAHAAGYDHRCRPIRRGHLRIRNDAYHQAACSVSALRGDTRSRASASADYGYAQAGKQFAGVRGQIVCLRSGLCASQHANLRTTDAGHGFFIPGGE